jgi:3-oxoadipate enol-lactonase/4-carboxymuconolactone decarboxylase
MQIDTRPNALSASGSERAVMESEARSVRTDDEVTIAYNVIGSGPQTLLFLHGWGGAGSGHSWAEVVKHLDLTGLRAILVDLRGHGRSEQTSSGFTIERFARDMFTVADDAQADKVVLVAYSMSGKWAQWMACTAPERVCGQVLVAPVPAAEIPLPEAEKERWLAVARSGDRELFEEWLRPWTKEPLDSDIVDRYFYDVTRTSQISLGATLDMCIHGGFMDRLQSIKAPTLVIGGRHDPILTPATLCDAVVTPIAGARFAVLDCGHEVPVEQPQILAALLEAFLAGLSA